MKNKATQTTNTAKTAKLKNLKPLSKDELETVIGGPEGSRGTSTEVP
ncbi:bacteriocin [Flavobacterium sp. RSSB_23]